MNHTNLGILGNHRKWKMYCYFVGIKVVCTVYAKTRKVFSLSETPSYNPAAALNLGYIGTPAPVTCAPTPHQSVYILSPHQKP